MRASGLADVVREARSAASALRDELALGRSGLVSVSGVLAEQLVRELGAGAEPGAVRTEGDGVAPGADVLVRVIAGEPTEVDLALVRDADARGVPVVLVQLWPQADWTRPFVLSPFVVECRAGEGFPMREIADRIVDAAEQAPSLAASIPALRGSVERKLIRQSVVRASLLALRPRGAATRPALTLEQLRLVARLGMVGDDVRARLRDDPALLSGVLGVVLAAGVGFRGVARTARYVLPAPVANAAVAAAGTWALARAARGLAARSGS
jgi:uncharacterized protein (DUF697 family)